MVWEPILPTDLRPPSGSTLARISDPQRVQQFWDSTHLVSEMLGRAASTNSEEPKPNSAKGFYWDQAILYPARVKWGDSAPPKFWGGPIYAVIDDLAVAVTGTQQ